MTILAKRLHSVRASDTKAVSQRAAVLRDAGHSIINLSLGEPDFDTPGSIREAAIAAIRNGETRYGPVAGAVRLREAIRVQLLRDQEIDYPIEQVTVGGGAKQVIFNAFLASVDPGDEIIIPSPCWVSYAESGRLAGGTPVFVSCREVDGFKLRDDQLERAITPRTRWLILNSPSNPTGAVYTRQELARLAAVLTRYPRIWILSDEIYEQLVYPGGLFCSTAAAAPELRDRVLTVNGLSKAHAMTGWRVGYGAGPLELIRAMNTIQGHSTSHASTIAQCAAIEALTGDQTHVAEFRAAFLRRRELMMDRINAIPGLRAGRPDGAFYLFASCEALIGHTTPSGTPLLTDGAVATYLLESAGVAVIAGTAFAASPFLRISFASSEADLQEACTRVAAACAVLAPPVAE